MSVSHSWLARSAVNCRCTRSSWTGGPALRFRPRFFEKCDQILCWEDSRHTRRSDALIPDSASISISISSEEQVASGRLAPGAKLSSERELVAEYRVSRPVVRVAVRSLQERGSVEVRPSRGAYVRAARSFDFASRFSSQPSSRAWKACSRRRQSIGYGPRTRSPTLRRRPRRPQCRIRKSSSAL